MIKKVFLTLPLCLGALVFGGDIDHELEAHIKELATEYVSYSYDYNEAYAKMLAEVISSKTSFQAPLVPALIVAALSFSNPLIFEDPDLLGRFVESILVGFSTYSFTFFVQFLALFPLVSIHQGARRCLAPQESKLLDYYAEKKEQIINELKNYIAENKILPEELDHIIHKAFPAIYQSPEYNRRYYREYAIVTDMLNKIHMDTSEKN